MKSPIFFSLIFLLLCLGAPTISIADTCPKNHEIINRTPYKKIYACSSVSVVIEGERNPEKYESCLGDVPIDHESVYLHKDEVRTPLSILDLAPVYPIDRTRTWMVSDVYCGIDNSIVVTYWGGGNCSKCEQFIQYEFNDTGHVAKSNPISYSNFSKIKGE